MKILAIDTSNHPMTVALLDGNELKATTTINTIRNHSIYLLPAINRLFKLAGWQPEDIDRIVVAKGPGSYTGIRIAVTMAKTLAMTLSKELVSVSSLAVIAKNVPIIEKRLIIPFFDARRGNVFAGGYQYVHGELKLVIPEKHVAFDELIDQLKTKNADAVLVGEITPHIQKKFTSLPDGWTLLPREYAMPSAYQLGILGINGKIVSDIDSFVPTYLRITEAEANWKKAHPGEQRSNYVREV